MLALFWLLTAVFFGAYICGPVMDPDLWWHITVGKWILAHGSVPRVDHWNLYAAGSPWRAYSWSNEVIFALADGVGGVRGLLGLKLVIAVALSASFGYCLSKIARDWYVGAILGAFGTVACFSHFTLRPQSVVWICFLWLGYCLSRIEREGARAGLLAGCFAIMAVWANSHLTTVLGIGLAVLWLARPDRWKLTILTVAVCFAGTLLTPYLGGEWLTFLSKTGHPLQHSSIVEFKPATILEYSTGFLIVAVSLLAVFLHYSPAALEPAKLVAAAGFVVAGLGVTKFLPFAVMVTLMMAAECWGRARERGARLGNIAEGIERSRAMLAKAPVEGMCFVLICATVVIVSQTWANPLRYSVVPVLAVDYIEDNDLPHPILNTFGNGGYLIYRFSNERGELERRVPIDGRTNVNTHETWVNFSAAFFGKAGWRGFIEQVKPNTILWRRESPFTPLLKACNEWCEVFTTGTLDDGYNVLVRREYFESRPALFPGRCNEPQMTG